MLRYRNNIAMSWRRSMLKQIIIYFSATCTDEEQRTMKHSIASSQRVTSGSDCWIQSLAEHRECSMENKIKVNSLRCFQYVTRVMGFCARHVNDAIRRLSRVATRVIAREQMPPQQRGT